MTACSWCNGTGTMRVMVRLPADFIDSRCPNCSGTGQKAATALVANAADELVRVLVVERDRMLLPVVRWLQRQIERSPRLVRRLSTRR